MGRVGSRNGETRNAYSVWVGMPEGKRPLGRARRRWVDNIKMDFRETQWDGIDWIDLAQNRNRWRALVNTVMNLRVPYNGGKFPSGCTIYSFSRRAQLHECVSEYFKEFRGYIYKVLKYMKKKVFYVAFKCKF
jgi:hypothetical protein